MRRRFKPFTIGLLAASALALVWTFGGDDGEASNAPAAVPAPALPEVRTDAEADTYARGKPEPLVAGLGIVEPAGGTIELASELPGVIVAVHVAEGDRVKKGDVVAELGNEELVAKVAQGKAQLAIRKADLERIQNGARLQEVQQAKDRVAELRAELELAEGDFERAARLQKTGTVSKKALQAAATRRTGVRRQVDASVAALSLIEEGARNEELLAATAEVRLATEQLAEAQAYLDKSFIRARSDGTVLRLFREAGEAVSTQPATAVAEIGDTSNLIVRAQIDEGEIADLAVGQMAEISAPAFGERRLSGRIVRLSPRIGTKIVEADTAGEKRDTRVLDAIIALDAGTAVPVNLRVDVFIYPSTHVAELEPSSGPLLDNWRIRE